MPITPTWPAGTPMANSGRLGPRQGRVDTVPTIATSASLVACGTVTKYFPNRADRWYPGEVGPAVLVAPPFKSAGLAENSDERERRTPNLPAAIAAGSQFDDA